MEHLSRLFANPHTTIVVTNFLAIIVSVALVILAIRLTEPNDKTPLAVGINGLLLVLGLLVGWALAVFWVPFDETEKSVFTQIGATVAAFVSGYAVSKFDRLLEAALYEQGRPVRIAVVRVGLFTGATLLAAVVIVTNRVDWLASDAANRKSKVSQEVKELPSKPTVGP